MSVVESNMVFRRKFKGLKYGLLVLCLCFWSEAYAQGNGKKIVIQKRELADAIKLKWNINQESDWLEIIQKGFVLERKKIREKGKLVLKSSFVVLDTLGIAPKEAWLKYNPNQNKYIAILSQALFGEKFQVKAKSSFIHQIKAQKNDREQRFSVGNLSLSADFNAAILAGSAYVDTMVSQDTEYIYRVKSRYDLENKQFQNIVLGSTLNYKPLNQPTPIEGNFEEQKVTLGWRLSYQNKSFVAYEIQVMGGDSTFAPINRSLIVPDVDAKMPDFMRKSFYSYRYPNNGIEQKYSFRYRGLTDFSEWSPYSDTLVGSPVHKLIANPTIVEVKNLTELNGFDLVWAYPSKELYRVKDIELEYAQEIYGQYTTITKGNKLGILGNNSTISIKKRMQTGYYRMRLKGFHAEYTLSMPRKITVPNTIPPDAPVFLKAKKKKTDGYTVVNLKWKANQEEDLLGYRIYRTTEKDGEYKLLDNNRFFEQTQHTDYIPEEDGIEAYYYRIKAVDRNYNHSAFSQPVKVSIFKEALEYPIKMIKKEVSQDRIKITFRIPRGKPTKKFSLYRKTSQNDFSQFVQDFNLEKDQKEFTFSDYYVQENTYYAYFGVSTYGDGKLSEKQSFPLIYVPKKTQQQNMPFEVKTNLSDEGVYTLRFSSFTINQLKVYVYKKRGNDQSMVFFFDQWKNQKVFEDKDYKTGDSYSLYVVSPEKQFPLFEL